LVLIFFYKFIFIIKIRKTHW